jgi:magnesium-transporting ATPase (P-type)
MQLKNIKNFIVIAWFLATIDIVLTIVGISNIGIGYEINYFPKYVYSNFGMWYGSLIIFIIELLTFFSFYYLFKYFIKHNMKSKIFIKPTLWFLIISYLTVNIMHLSWYI